MSAKPEALDPTGAGVTGGCEVLRGCWELHLGTLEKQYVVLTAEPSL